MSNTSLHTTQHEWLQALADGSYAVGITDAGQEMLGDIVFCGDAQLGKILKAGETCAIVESVKAASDVHMPIDGVVIAFNTELELDPTALNSAAYNTWIIKIKPAATADLSLLLSAASYQQSL